MSKGTLIVEGQDDRHVMYALFKEYNIDFERLFNIVDLDGFDNFSENITTIMKASSRIAIVVDADIDIKARWTSLRDKFRSLGFTMSENPDESGSIAENPEGDLIGIWLMPNNLLPGMLEDFLKMLIPDGDRLIEDVVNFTNNLPENETRFKEVHRAKAVIHTYLSIRDEPTTRFATAIKARLLDYSKPEAENLIRWVNKVLVA